MKQENTEWIEEMMHYLPARDGLDRVRCERHVSRTRTCFAVLSADPLAKGHALVVLKRHRLDIVDTEPNELKSMSETIVRCSRAIKNALEDDGVERVYVASLCDGVEHLHFHLIPRFKNDERGFRYMGEKEFLYPCMVKTIESLRQKEKYWQELLPGSLQKIAEDIRNHYQSDG